MCFRELMNGLLIRNATFHDFQICMSQGGSLGENSMLPCEADFVCLDLFFSIFSFFNPLNTPKSFYFPTHCLRPSVCLDDDYTYISLHVSRIPFSCYSRICGHPGNEQTEGWVGCPLSVSALPFLFSSYLPYYPFLTFFFFYFFLPVLVLIIHRPISLALS